MQLTKFRFNRIQSLPVHMAQRYSIIVPLVEGSASGEHFLAVGGTRDSLIQVLEKWRERVKELRVADWAYVESGSTLLYCLNCPPPFSYTEETARPCNRYLVCPMCWARRVAKETYERVEYAVYGTNWQTKLTSEGRKRIDHRSDVDLFELVDSVYYSRCHILAEELAAAEQENLTRHKRHLSQASGVYYLTTIEPGDNDWLVQRRLLAIVPPAVPSKGLPGGNDSSDIRRHKLVNKDQIAGAVGRVCRYPSGMMLGDAKSAVEILHARGGTRGGTIRLSTYHGSLRASPKKRKRVLDLRQEGPDVDSLERRSTKST